jgi:hypothetical protein
LETIGNLARKIAPTAPTATSTGGQLPSNFGGIGPGQTPETPSSATGIGRGKIGLTVIGQGPVSADQNAVESLPPCVRSWLKARQTYLETSHCDNSKPPAPLTEDMRRQSLAVLKQAMVPMDQRKTLGLLGELKLLTIPRTGDDPEEIRAQILIYARKLADYPADAVHEVLTTQADQSKFWPAWAELKDRLDARTWQRTEAMKALKAIPAQ